MRNLSTVGLFAHAGQQLENRIDAHCHVADDDAAWVYQVRDRRREHSIAARNFPSLLKHHRKCQSVLNYFKSIFIEVALANHHYFEFRLVEMELLQFGGQLVAGPAMWVGKDQEDAPAPKFRER